MTRMRSVHGQKTPSQTTPSLKTAGLFSNWAARAFSAKKRSDSRRCLNLSGRPEEVESLEVRVMLDVPDSNDQISEAVIWTRGQMAAPITSSTTGNQIGFFGDVNMHGFTAYAGERLGIDLDRPSGTLDSRLRLFSSAGVELANNDDGSAPGEGFTRESYLDFTFSTSGTYYLGVSYYVNDIYDPLTGNGDNTSLGRLAALGPYDITFSDLTVDNDDQISEATVWNRSIIDTTTPSAAISVPTDVDMYRIQVVAGETFGFDLDRTGGNLDSFLRLFDSTGTQLAFNDDRAAPGEAATVDSYISYTFATSGLYYLAVSSYYNFYYDATTGAGDSLEAWKTGTYTLTITNIDPDDQISEATAASIGTTATGTIDSALDVDMYAVTVAANQQLFFDIDAPSSPLDSRLRLFNAAGTELANNDDAVGPGVEYTGVESFFRYTFATAGTYYVAVSYFTNNTYNPLTGTGDSKGIATGIGAYNLNIGVVNQPPAITAAGNPGTTIWNTQTYFTQGGSFSVSDADAGSSVVQATLSATNATVSLLQIPGSLSFTVGDGTDDSTMTFTGTINAINTALYDMTTYTGGVVGGVTLTLTINDLGNTGGDGAKTATSSVSWFNTFMDFNAAAPGVMRLYGLQSAETSSLFVDSDLGVVGFTVNGINFTTGIVPADVVQLQIYLRGGDDDFTAAGSSAFLNVTLINSGGGNDRVDARLLTHGISQGILGAAGRDVIYGGQGNDVITLSINDGGDVDGWAGNDTINGSQVADFIQDTSGDNFIYAGDGDDTIVTFAGNDFIDAGAGNDQISAGAGNDTVYAGVGNDSISGGNDNDILYGGTGDDTFLFSANVFAGTGIDQVFEFANEGTDLLNFDLTASGVNLAIDLRSTVAQNVAPSMPYVWTLQLNLGNTFERVVGGQGNDTLIGNALNNTLDGGGGNDSYFGLQGNDTYVGSFGNDTYNFDADSSLGTDSLTGVDAGVDTINLFATTSTGTTLNLGNFGVNQVVNANLSLNISSDSTIENILGTDLVDNYTGNAADNQFDLRGGDDTASGLAGNDRFIGGTGNDTLNGGNDNDTYVFDADIAQGTDTLLEAATLAGGIDTLDFGLTNLTASSLAIDLRTVGVQTVRAAAVSLSLGGSTRFENVIAGAGNDNIIGNNLANSLAGGGGNDLIYGFAGDDILDGGLGNDTYMFDADSNIGSDTVTDSGGTDTLNWLATTTGSGVTVNLGSTAAQNLFVSGFHTLTLTDGNSIENAIGTNQADDLRGNALNNVLTANGGNDRLEGFAGNDTLIGGAGNDTYSFNADNVLGADLLNESGGGVDTLSFVETLVTNLNIDLRIAGYQTIAAGNLSLSLQNATAFEWVIGGFGNDRITGNSVNNILIGLAGNDIIYGQGGNDVLSGGDGNDTLVGEAGRDLIIGGNDSDTINGGTDADLIIGGNTNYDDIPSMLNTILSIWTGAGSYATRAAAVQTGATALDAANVFDDGSPDVLRGGTGSTDDQLDLFFSSALDTLPDFDALLELNVVI